MGLSINLEGKVALITGASSGLGARFAHTLAAA
ncbi:short-chain dehydrogenase, partial [Escherichia coli]|nr:short-chain dehydrogenase [Escherichia coli]